jgi:hypothetical protein
MPTHIYEQLKHNQKPFGMNFDYITKRRRKNNKCGYKTPTKIE